MAGNCFAGNSAFDACIGMGGPATDKSSSLGSFDPDSVGPSNVQQSTGVINVLVHDEAGALA